MSITMKSIEHGIFQGPLNCWPLVVVGRNRKETTTNRANPFVRSSTLSKAAAGWCHRPTLGLHQAPWVSAGAGY